MTIEEFGQKIKQKYPQYNDMSNSDLGQKMITKYPQYRDMVQTSIQKSQMGKTQGFFQGLGQNIEQGVQNISNIPIAGSVLGPLAQAGAGVEKEVATIGQGAVQLGGKLLGKNIPSAPSLEPQGIAEKIGSIGTQIGEFAIPEALIGKYLGVAHSGIEALGLASKYGKAGRAAEAILKAGASGAKEAGVFGSTEAVRSGGDIGKTIGAATLGATAGIIGETAKALGVGKFFDKLNLRLTPKQNENLAPKMKGILDTIKQYGVSNKLTPTGKFKVIDSAYQDYEKTLQDFLETNNTAKGIFANKGAIIDGIRQMVNAETKDMPAPEVTKIINQGKSAIGNIVNQYKKQDIPISRLNVLKRNTWQRAFSDKSGQILSYVELKLGDIYKTAIEDATKGLTLNGKDIGEFNKEYGSIINARKVLKAAQFRPETGIAGRIIGSMTGMAEIGGGPVAKGIGFELGNIASQTLTTPARTLAGRALENAPNVAKTIQPLLRNQ